MEINELKIGDEIRFSLKRPNKTQFNKCEIFDIDDKFILLGVPTLVITKYISILGEEETRTTEIYTRSFSHEELENIEIISQIE